jgi:hypothetical protein
MYYFVIPLLPFLEASFIYLENSLVQSDFSFIHSIVINDVNIDFIPKALQILFTLTIENW